MSMPTMMLTKDTAKFIAEAQRHVAMDLVCKGYYDKNEQGRACFIGCHTGGNNPQLLQEWYGFPLALTRICENVFEELPRHLGISFHAAIPAAVGVDGKDLSRVHWAFLAAELREFPPQRAEVQLVIDPIIAGMDLLANGKDWPSAAARAARAVARASYAAARAADTATDAAARAADGDDAACAAAYAARIRQRNTILALIAAAPMMKTKALAEIKGETK